jgi:hypothetical protein
VLLKIYIYGYLNRIQSSRRLERETQRNVELMWLTNRLTPDFKTIADFRKDNGPAIRNVCRRFVLLCHKLNMFEGGEVAIDGSKFKAVNNRDKNYTQRKIKARIEQVEDSIARYMEELDRADRQPELTTRSRIQHIKQKIVSFKRQIEEFNALTARLQKVLTSKSRKQIPMLVPWLPAAVALAWWAITSRRRSIQNTIALSPMKSPMLAMIAPSLPA